VFDQALRQLLEEASALVVCDARLGFELVRREGVDPKLYRDMQAARQAIREILAMYKQEIREMEAPSPISPTRADMPFPRSMCRALRRAGLACDASGYQQAIRQYGGATVPYHEFVRRLDAHGRRP